MFTIERDPHHQPVYRARSLVGSPACGSTWPLTHVCSRDLLSLTSGPGMSGVSSFPTFRIRRVAPFNRNRACRGRAHATDRSSPPWQAIHRAPTLPPLLSLGPATKRFAKGGGCSRGGGAAAGKGRTPRRRRHKSSVSCLGSSTNQGSAVVTVSLGVYHQCRRNSSPSP